MRHLVALAFASCAVSPLGSGLTEVAIGPEPSWRAEWDWTWANCGSRWVARPHVAFEAVRWVRVEGGDGYRFRYGEIEGANGFYDITRHVVGFAPYVVTGFALDASWSRRHEMLHAQTGVCGHPPRLFGACERLAVDGGALTP